MYTQYLRLSHFKNHTLYEAHFEKGPVVFYGDNGSGKTNILEALSYFSAGRGLKGAKLADLSPLDAEGNPTENSWAMSMLLKDEALGEIKLSSFLQNNKRINKIGGELAKSTTAFSEFLSIFWLTPEHDRLFSDSSKIRRKFLDRMVFAYDTQHASHLLEYEAAVKERMTLLKNGIKDDIWLNVIEEKMANNAVEILFSRFHMLNRLQESALELSSAFPKFKCVYKGEFESIIGDALTKNAFTLENQQLSPDMPAQRVYWKNAYKNRWRETRELDLESRKTTIGIHKADFTVIHPSKGLSFLCSTGEQKILLMGIVLSFLKGRLKFDRKLILILLDECVSHFDFAHRMVLFDELLLLHHSKEHPGTLQAFMTGTDKNLFTRFEGHATFHYVSAEKEAII